MLSPENYVLETLATWNIVNELSESIFLGCHLNYCLCWFLQEGR